jgi:hypothetical protein
VNFSKEEIKNPSDRRSGRSGGTRIEEKRKGKKRDPGM